MSNLEEWRYYPRNVEGSDDVFADAQEADKRFLDVNGDVFIKESDGGLKIQITDISNEAKQSRMYNTFTEAKQALTSEPQDLRVRIISICCAITIAPLQDPNLAEGSSSTFACVVGKDNNESKISYQLRYVEENNRSTETPWSFRHTGVYHHHTQNKDIIILLHPNSRARMDRRLGDYINTLDNVESRKNFCHQAYLVHGLLMSCYLDNWQLYFRYLGNKFSTINDLALGQDPKKLNSAKSFKWVQSLRNTNDFALFARACCSGNLDLLQRLEDSDIGTANGFGGFTIYTTRMRGYMESADVLKDRIRNTIDLVGYTLSLHNQLEAGEISRQLRDLTFQTVDDSSTVKLITVFSAVFLPGSFVGTIYGMNFFRFDQETKRISIANDFWIFIATWLPMTTLVGILYFLFLRQTEKSKGKPFWPWNAAPAKNSRGLPVSRSLKPLP